jgi:hypothetical protein
MKTLKLLTGILMLLMSSILSFGAYPFDVQSSTYALKFISLSDLETATQGFTWNNDGTIFYFTGSDQDDVFQKTCSTPYDISTCTVFTYSLNNYAVNPTDIKFNNDGTKFYITETGTTDRILQYSCSTAYRVSTCTTGGLSLTSSLETQLQGFTWNNDGTKIFLIGMGGDTVYQYSCSTAYTINTCTYDNISKSVTAQATLPTKVYFNNDGTKFYILDYNTDSVYEYSCSTAYTVNSCTYASRFKSVTSQDSGPYALTFNALGDKMYIGGQTSDKAFQYNILVSILELNSSLVNNTYFNTSSIQINTSVLNTSTNGNVNQTYYLYYNNGTLVSSSQYATNNVNGSLNLTSLTDNVYLISFYARNNETNVTSSNYTFTIDTTAPVINNNILAQYNYYNISGFNSSCTDTNILSCNISVNSQNVLLNTSSFLFTTNGNQTYNITAVDLAGNTATATGVTLVNPLFYVYFNNNTDYISNFSINGIAYTDYFSSNIYDYGLGTHEFLFQKTGYDEKTFNVTLNASSNINQTIYVNPVFITINLLNIDNGSLAPTGNYTIILTNDLTSETTSYNILNNNTLTIENLYAQDTNITLSVVSGGNITTTNELVTTRLNVTLNVYITLQTTETRIIEALTGNLLVIPFSDIYLYTYIEGTGFVLETIRETNILGQATFNIVPLTKIYNLCNIYNGVEKCLSQVTFVNSVTDPYQIVHDVNNSASEKIFLNYLSWSYAENKTNETTEMTMTFNDAQSLVTSFCYNATRYTNGTQTFTQEYCNNNPSGQIVQTFSLNEYQKITFNYFYIYEGERNSLGTFTTYGENSSLILLNQASLFDILFLVIYFVAIGLLLGLNNFTYYNAGFMIIALLIFSVQGYFNENYIYVGIWVLLALSKLTYYFVKVEG